MQFVIGSATLLALVFLVLSATAKSSKVSLTQLRHVAYMLSCAVAGLVTFGDFDGFAMLLGPTLALYEATALVTR